MLPAAELRRRARNRDPKASSIYKLAANQKGLELLLVILGAISAIELIVLAAHSSWWGASLTIILIASLVAWRPKPEESAWLWLYMAWAAPYIFKITKSVLPTLDRIAGVLPVAARADLHLGIYEKEDLINIINRQAKLPSNHIPEEDLLIAANALTFGDKKVSDIMTPRRKVRFVSETEDIGPMLMDELHATGQMIFPVVRGSSKPANPEIIGMLHLLDLLDNPDKQKVKDIVHHGRATIDESKNLREVLDEFIKTKKNLLVVVDKFEEVVGAVTLNSVIEQIIGKKVIEDSSDQS